MCELVFLEQFGDSLLEDKVGSRTVRIGTTIHEIAG